MKRAGLCSFAQLLALPLAFIALSAAGATTLSVIGPDGVSSTFSTSVGGTLDVGIYISSYSDLYAWQFDLNWDPTILSLNTISEGSALASAGTTFFVPGTIDKVDGQVTDNADTLIGAIPGASGSSAALAFFNFSALAVGSTAINIANFQLVDSTLNNISASAISGTAAVTGSTTTPEPSFSFIVALVLLSRPVWVWLRRALFANGSL